MKRRIPALAGPEPPRRAGLSERGFQQLQRLSGSPAKGHAADPQHHEAGPTPSARSASACARPKQQVHRSSRRPEEQPTFRLEVLEETSRDSRAVS